MGIRARLSEAFDILFFGISHKEELKDALASADLALDLADDANQQSRRLIEQRDEWKLIMETREQHAYNRGLEDGRQHKTMD